MKYLLISLLICGVGLCCHCATGQSIAYTDATIETLGEPGRIDRGTVLIRDGNIEAVGDDIQIPRDAQRISLEGATILPGFIDPYYVFKSTKGGEGSRTVTFRGRTFTIPSNNFSAGSFYKVGAYFYPYETNFLPALRSGITTANLVTDGRGLSALAQLTPVPDAEMLIDDESLLFAQVTNQTDALDVIRKQLSPQSGSRGKGGSSPAQRRSGGSAASRNQNKSDETDKLWKDVRDGKSKLIVNANNAATISHVLKMLEETPQAEIALVASGPNLFLAIDELKAYRDRVTVILQPGIDTVPNTREQVNVSKLLADAGVPLAYSLSLSRAQMNASLDAPLFPIAMMVKSGLSRELAFKALVTEPARILGVEATHGSLEPGKVADLLVFSGDPLATDTKLEQVISGGRVIHDYSKP